MIMTMIAMRMRMIKNIVYNCTFPPAPRPSPQLHERPEQAAAEEMIMILMTMTKMLMLMMISNMMIIVMIIFKTCQ